MAKDVRQLIDNNRNTVAALRISSVEEVDGSGGSAQSTAVTDESIIRIVSESDIRVAFGTNPTATSTSTLIPAGVVEYFRLNVNDKVAVLSGVANITTME